MSVEFPSPSDVVGRRVVVTGASGGLGEIICTAFSRAGARVALISRSPQPLEDLAARLPGETIVIPADVTSPEDNERVVHSVVTAWGGLDVWVANAGISPIVGTPSDTTPDIWQQVIDVDLSGVYYGARAAAAELVEGGRIIVTTSVLGERPRRGMCAYSAAKAGAIALVKGLALDLGSQGVTVNAVSPGWFDSPLAAGFMTNPTLARSILDHTALGRWGASEDLPGAYLFLASRASDFVTGAVITVDGGYLCI